MSEEIGLDKSTVERVEELIEINVDSHNGLMQAVQETRGTSLPRLFTEVARERLSQAKELQDLVSGHRGQSLRPENIATDIRRAIMDWHDAFGEGPQSVLRKAERGENYVKAKYEAALSHRTDTSIVETLHRQYEAVKRARNKICRSRKALVTIHLIR